MRAIEKFFDKLFPTKETLEKQQAQVTKDLASTKENLGNDENIDKLAKNTGLDRKMVVKLLNKKEAKEIKKLDKIGRKIEKLDAKEQAMGK